MSNPIIMKQLKYFFVGLLLNSQLYAQIKNSSFENWDSIKSSYSDYELTYLYNIPSPETGILQIINPN